MFGASARRGPTALIAANAVFVAIVAAGAVGRLVTDGAISGPYLVSVGTSVPVHVAVAAGAYRLRGSTISPEFYPQIVRWTVLGAVVLGALLGVFAPFLYDSWVAIAGTVRWGIAVGGGGGFAAGYVTARLTERRVAAERASVRAEEAERRRELLEDLNALLRHEVLNSTTVVQGRAAHLQSKLDGDATDHLAAIERQADEMAAIVREVRVLIRASDDAGDRSPVDVTDVVEREVRAIDDQHAAVETDLDLPGEAIVRANDLLPKAFENLLRNSVEHGSTSPRSSSTPGDASERADAASVRVAVSASVTGDSVEVRVEDDGPGVPESLREDLFAPTIDRLDEESRLGTAIVGRIVEQCGGDVELTETGPDGTVVTVTLPLAGGDAPGEQTEPAGGPRPATT